VPECYQFRAAEGTFVSMVTPEKDANVEERDEFTARLRQVVDAYGSTSALARKLERSEGALRKWLRGKSEPNVSDVRRICEVTATNVEWLVTGRGTRNGPLSVRDSTIARSAAAMRLPFDYPLFDALMASVEDEARALGIELPRTKRSSMIGMLYDRFADAGEIDREVIARMVRLAQI
jgi:transcriptional regulator with XRE-family HTH domain